MIRLKSYKTQLIFIKNLGEIFAGKKTEKNKKKC